METPRDAGSQELGNARSAMRSFAAASPALTLDTGGSRAVEAWFLGPKGENAEQFERMVVEALRDHVFWRRNYHPGDASHISEAIKRSPQYTAAIDSLEDGFRGLLAALKKSVPFFSPRYQGHMNWDLTTPACSAISRQCFTIPIMLLSKGRLLRRSLNCLSATICAECWDTRFPRSYLWQAPRRALGGISPVMGLSPI
jgi:hypothetical protein